MAATSTSPLPLSVWMRTSTRAPSPSSSTPPALSHHTSLSSTVYSSLDAIAIANEQSSSCCCYRGRFSLSCAGHRLQLATARPAIPSPLPLQAILNKAGSVLFEGPWFRIE